MRGEEREGGRGEEEREGGGREGDGGREWRERGGGRNRGEGNQSPTGNIWSSVPLACFSLCLLKGDVCAVEWK